VPEAKKGMDQRRKKKDTLVLGLSVIGTKTAKEIATVGTDVDLLQKMKTSREGTGFPLGYWGEPMRKGNRARGNKNAKNLLQVHTTGGINTEEPTKREG